MDACFVVWDWAGAGGLLPIRNSFYIFALWSVSCKIHHLTIVVVMASLTPFL